MTKKKGFTLAELLIAILILSILSTVGTYTFAYSQKRARDTQRKRDLDQVAKALELARQDCTGGKYYPVTPGTPNNPQNNFVTLGPYLSGTVKYMNSVPQNPTSNSVYNYGYSFYTSGANYYSTNACPDNTGSGAKPNGSTEYFLRARLEITDSKLVYDNWNKCQRIPPIPPIPGMTGVSTTLSQNLYYICSTPGK